MRYFFEDLAAIKPLPAVIPVGHPRGSGERGNPRKSYASKSLKSKTETDVR